MSLGTSEPLGALPSVGRGRRGSVSLVSPDELATALADAAAAAWLVVRLGAFSVRDRGGLLETVLEGLDGALASRDAPPAHGAGDGSLASRLRDACGRGRRIGKLGFAIVFPSLEPLTTPAACLGLEDSAALRALLAAAESWPLELLLPADTAALGVYDAPVALTELLTSHSTAPAFVDALPETVAPPFARERTAAPPSVAVAVRASTDRPHDELAIGEVVMPTAMLNAPLGAPAAAAAPLVSEAEGHVEVAADEVAADEAAPHEAAPPDEALAPAAAALAVDDTDPVDRHDADADADDDVAGDDDDDDADEDDDDADEDDDDDADEDDDDADEDDEAESVMPAAARRTARDGGPAVRDLRSSLTVQAMRALFADDLPDAPVPASPLIELPAPGSDEAAALVGADRVDEAAAEPAHEAAEPDDADLSAVERTAPSSDVRAVSRTEHDVEIRDLGTLPPAPPLVQTPRPAPAAPSALHSSTADDVRRWTAELDAARGPKPLAAVERLFSQTFVPLREAVVRGEADDAARTALTAWSAGFEKSYLEAFDALRVRGKRPTMVLDLPELAQRVGRLHGARSVQLLLVDGMRFDLGLRVHEYLRSLLGQSAALTERFLAWSALPTTTSAQLDLLGRGPEGLRDLRTPDSEPPVARGKSAASLRRVRAGVRELMKLDVVEARLAEPGAPPYERFDGIALEAAESIANHFLRLPPRTLVLVFGDHGFFVDERPGRPPTVRQGGASPEETLVPAFSWLVGSVH